MKANGGLGEIVRLHGALNCWIDAKALVRFKSRTHRLIIWTMKAETIAVSTIEEDEGMEEDMTESDDVANTRWHLFGNDCPKEEIEFLC